MHDRVEKAIDADTYRFFTQEQVDTILREGAKLGRNGSHIAIERILKHEPMLERAQLWRRIRQLKRPPTKSTRRRIVWNADDDQLLRIGYSSAGKQKHDAIRQILSRHPDWEASSVWKRARKLGFVHPNSIGREQRRKHRWSQEEDTTLIGLAGEVTLATIAQKLGRSERAIACRLAWWGRRRRMHNEGYARKSLARELHMGWATIQRLIVDGFLEVRDPRISKESIAKLHQLGSRPDSMTYKATALVDGRPSSSSDAARTLCRTKRIWVTVAEKLNTNLTVVETLIRQGVLKFCDPRITESSLQVFCHRYGATISREFLPEDTREWLRSCMDFDPNTGREVAKRFAASREHAMIVRTCEKCGRTIRGNVFFRHLKNCRKRQNPARLAFSETLNQDASPRNSPRPGTSR